MPWLLLVLGLSTMPAMAQTQADMNEASCTQVQTANKTLIRVVQQVLNRHKGDVTATQAIQRSQAAWQAFQTAQLNAIFPEADKSSYGTVYGMCSCMERAALIQQRIKQLSAWIKPREGDVCAGSRF